MNAEDTLRRYKNGERSFCGKSFRGYDFKDQNLSGVDFSYTDIRGANFTNATLEGANFTRAKAGLQRRWIFIQLILAFLILFLFYFLPGYMGFWVSSVFEPTSIKTYYTSTPAIAVAMAIIASIVIVLWQGFTLRTLVAVAAISPITSYFAGAVGIAGAVLVFVSGAVAIVITVAGKITRTGTVLGVILVTIVGIFAVSRDSEIGSSGFVALSGAVIGILLVVTLSSCISWRALLGDFKFSIILNLAISFGVLGGTSFKNANLTKAIFTKAIVKSSNFSGADLTHVCWKDAKGLNHAELGDSIISNIKVRELLITHNGYKKDYAGCNLRGANLVGADLSFANLSRADLGNANLYHANLKESNLTEAQAVGTNFGKAYLTGACLEAWNIDSTTQLDETDCDYVYLLKPPQERRPSSGIFQPGEFSKLFEEVLNTIDLIFQNGIDWKAFLQTFRQVQVEHEGAELAIQSIENKGDGVVVVKLHAAPNTDKAVVHQSFMSGYQTALQEAEERYRAQLHAKDYEIQYHRQQNANMQEVVKLLAARPINIDVKATAESKAMQGNDQSQSFNVQGNFIINAQNSVVSLREISGQVSNQISQLPTESTSDQTSLKELLTQLQQAVEADTELGDSEKAEALVEVGELASAAQNPKEGVMQKAAKGAMNAIKGIVAGLSDASKLASACKELMPLIMTAFGLP